MHIRTFYRQRRGTRSFAEAVAATGINKGALSRIERGEQFPKAEQCRRLAEFYDAETARIVASFVTLKTRPDVYLARLYPASVLRCIQLERKCVDCGRPLPPDSRANRKRHVKGGCS
jgi:transcriptional regulator with XRE-family HTH domain